MFGGEIKGENMIARYIAVFLYAAMVITIGIKGSRKTKSFDDFTLGGGKVGACRWDERSLLMNDKYPSTRQLHYSREIADE